MEHQKILNSDGEFMLFSFNQKLKKRDKMDENFTL